MRLAITSRAAALIAEAEGFDQPGRHPETQRVNNLLHYIAGQFLAMKRIWQGQGLDGLLTRRENEAKLVESAVTA